jgi:hypothetical protein
VIECALKNVMLNRSKVFCGIGFNNLGFVAGGGSGGRAIIMFLDNNREIGKWFELCGRLKSICDVYIFEVGDFMKYPSSKLVCV